MAPQRFGRRWLPAWRRRWRSGQGYKETRPRPVTGSQGWQARTSDAANSEMHDWVGYVVGLDRACVIHPRGLVIGRGRGCACDMPLPDKNGQAAKFEIVGGLVLGLQFLSEDRKATRRGEASGSNVVRGPRRPLKNLSLTPWPAEMFRRRRGAMDYHP
ncbi:hypothetical protein B0T17DRAFT_502483 [Bombardia bombarda]|uniref:Uncharacterized protein n=1 Tax=Bombardia bombarda TaxID=252184 RepID=A0AA40CEW6_9PEZI|nr:hypothetical protein B0T17DRAFT_502483 [Bombardia bombarda]